MILLLFTLVLFQVIEMETLISTTLCAEPCFNDWKCCGNEFNSGVSDQQSVGSSPSHDSCDLKQGLVCCVTHIKNPVHLFKREGVRPGVPGWIGSILRHSTL